MTEEGSTDWAWEDDIVRGLRSLTGSDMPGLEILLLDAVVDWLFSTGNPGQDHGEEHAGHLVSTLFSAVDGAPRFLPARQPEATADITEARARIVDGAHELAVAGASGVSLIVSRLMPAMLAELGDNAGERGKQARGIFVYLLYALAIGTRDEQEPALMDGVASAFAGWDTVLRGGYLVPWRQPPPQPPA